ncbi:hypothetical protein ACFQY0_13565 [Haloferula chungangensis]|uniref:Uncharacterized protein n=1 Tax=Haloferula chungangensis TaxID=1048331 RepID=A0ABW2L780_9BACT
MKQVFIFLLLATPAFGGDAKSPVSSGGNWQWTVSAGPAIRNIGTLKINSGYRSGGVIPPSFVGSSSLTEPNVGAESSTDDRFYNDGYVRQDAGTSTDGNTWYWGYDNAAQVQDKQLAYSATGYQSILRDSYSIPSFGASSRDSLRGFSPHIQVDARGPQKLWGFQLGFSGGFDFTHVDQSLAYSNYSGNQFRDDYRLDYVDSYDLNGVIPPLAPYFGTLGGPGPVIGNVPTSRSITPVLLFTDTASFSNQVWSSIDINVFSFTVGPTLTRSWGPLSMSLQGGLIFNIYDWDAQQGERLTGSNSSGTSTVANWAEGDSGTKFRPGLYGQADISYDVGNNWAIGCYFRVDTAAEFRAQAGPSTFKVDPSGYSAGFQLRYLLP